MSVERKLFVNRLLKKILDGPELIDTSFIFAAGNYTGLHYEYLSKLEAVIDLSEEIIPEEVDRDVIAKKYKKHCIQSKSAPSTMTLYTDLVSDEDIPAYIDINTLRKLLLKHGFIWKKHLLRDTYSYVVIEDPVVRFQRYDYLKKILFYKHTRENDVIYVGECACDVTGTCMTVKESRMFEVKNGWQQRFVYAVNKLSLVSVEDIDEFSAKVFEDWLLRCLCRKLTRPSIIVIHDLEHHNRQILQPPTLTSTKKQIMEWLDFHNIPYSSKASKFELYSLVENCTDNQPNTYKVDQILEANGHTVLRIPKSVERLTLTRYLFAELSDGLPESVASAISELDGKDANEVARNMFKFYLGDIASSEDIEGYWRRVVTDEEALLKEELLMDKVMSGETVGGGADDSDFPSSSDSE